MTYLESCAQIPIIESVYRERNNRRRFVRQKHYHFDELLPSYVFDNDTLLYREPCRFFRNETSNATILFQ